MTKSAIFYDTETTGVKSGEDRIIEIGAYDPANERKFSTLIHPKRPIPKEATAVHHITDAMVQDAPSFAEAGQQFAAFCGPDAVLVAHNNDAFDRLFLEAEFTRNGLELPSWNYVDSLKWARKYRPDLPRHSLQHLREYFGIPANQAHRALDDSMILYRVVLELVDDLDWTTILKLATEKRLLRQMPFGKHKGQPLKDVPTNYIQWLHENGALDKANNKELKESLIAIGKLSS